jgi:MFS family permease
LFTFKLQKKMRDANADNNAAASTSANMTEIELVERISESSQVSGASTVSSNANNVSKLTKLGRRYVEIATAGLGMFCEAYIIFSVGNISPFQKAMFPTCFETYEDCPKAVIEQKVDSYIQICGIMLGMLLMGVSADKMGRQWGSRVVGTIMLTGVILLTITPFAMTPFGYFVFFMAAQTWYGMGVGGEYPLASSTAAENAEEHPKLRHHRGREVILVFANQGIGNLANCIVILVAMAMFGQTGSTLDSYGSKQVVSLQYGVGAAVCLVMVVYRMVYLQESSFYQKEHEASLQKEKERTEREEREAREDAATKAAKAAAEWETTLKLIEFYGPRQLAASLAWIANDFTFYGNKLQQSFYIALMYPAATPYEQMKFTVLNSAISLCGYYAAAAVIDKHWYGRRTCQTLGFLMLFFLNVIIFVDYDNMTSTNASPVTLAWFQAIYYMSSFFNQFGPNCTTWLVAGEIFPTAIRATSHGFAATMGKLGAIISSIWIVNLHNPRDVFLVSSLWAVGGALVTWVFLPDTTGLDLCDLDQFHCCLERGHVELYHAEAVNPKHMSMWENAVGWSQYYDRQHNGHKHGDCPADAAGAAIGVTVAKCATSEGTDV